MLGLAAKGRNVVSGEQQTLAAVKDGSAMLVIVAEDATENTKKLFSDKCSFYQVPRGIYGTREELGHAIGKGILIAEMQQNSNTTYRVYDYGRVGADGKPRELHVEKALEVTTLTPAKPQNQLPATGSTQLLAHCDYFFTTCTEVETFCQVSCDRTSFVHLLVLEGDAVLQTQQDKIPVTKGTSVFVPAGTGAFRIIGKCKFINTTIR